MKFREEETGTRRLTKRTLRVEEKLAQLITAVSEMTTNMVECTDEPPVRLVSPYIQHLLKTGQLELHRRSRELRLHQSHSIGEIKSAGVQQYFQQLAPVTVVRRDKGHFSGL